MNFSLEYININIYYILLIILFIYTIYFYNKSIYKNSNILICRILIVLRSISILLLLLLLLNPTFKYSKSSIKNSSITLVLDQSESIGENLSNDNIQFLNIIYDIENWGKQKNVIFDYISFGENIYFHDSFKDIVFQDTLTNFDNINNYLMNIKNNVILISDGLNNTGKYNSSIDYKNSIHTLGIGNSSVLNNDIKINNILSETIFDEDSLLMNIIIENNFPLLSSNKNIYLSNDKNQKMIIGTYSFDKNVITKEIILPLSIFSIHNYISIDAEENEQNISNNTYYLNVNNNIDKHLKGLLITGSLSNNTQYIKKNILSELKEYSIDHIYRINERLWNRELDLNNINNYDLVILDNFPLIQSDSKSINMIKKNYNNYLVYSLGLLKNQNKVLNDFLNEYDCYYEESLTNNDKINFNINSASFQIPNNVTSYYINCKNAIKYDNGNTFIFNNNKSLLFFISDIKLLESKINIMNSKNNISKLFVQSINDLIYKRDKSIDIYALENQYFINENFNIYMKINEDISSDNIYLYLENLRNNTNEKIYLKDKIDKSNYFFDINLTHAGLHKISARYKNNDNNFTSSNLLNIEINYQPKETENIYLNQEYLMDISSKSKGYYAHHSQLKTILEKIDTEPKEINEKKRVNSFTYKYFWLFFIFLISTEWYLRNKIGLL